MFETLTERLGRTVRYLSGTGRLTEENIKDTLREVRAALLEADVALPVVRELIEAVRQKAMGQEVARSLSPGQMFVKLVNNELIHIMGAEHSELNLQAQPPVIILLAGLQGSGKTTTAAKLARWLKEQKKKTALLVSTDIYRPAAIEQLRKLASDLDIAFQPSSPDQDPVTIAQAAVQAAKRQVKDVLIIDTAGRLHVDDAMMTEIKAIHAAVNPVETLFVVDGMTGHDAVNTAQAFNSALPLTGVILTKMDGDARGGAALSVRHVTGKPIKFLGMGEKTQALEIFYPDRIASRILGMGDIVSLVEKAQQQLDQEQAKKMAKKLQAGKGFNLEDFKQQIQQMHKLGGIAGLLDKLPGGMMGALPAGAKNQMHDGMLKKIEAMINSMTQQERRFPDIIKGSRKRRIAAGSGTEIQDVNRLLKQFSQMQKMMKKMRGSGGMMKMLRGMKNMLPPGMLPPNM